MINLWKTALKISGWKASIDVPDRDKSVICVAPHTSNFDFIIGLIAYRSIGRKANFLMKDFWFFFPLNYLLEYLGGIPVVRKNKKESLTDVLISDFKKRKKFNLAVTPEGTRKAVEKWHTGFLYVANKANVPIQLGVIDYKAREVIVEREYQPTGDIERDLELIKDYYRQFPEVAKYPENFKI